MKSNKFWIIILAAVLLISLITAFALRQKPANIARITLDGEVIEIIDLSAVSEPYSITVECEAGTNVVSVENGRIRISEADCPDGACIRQGWIGGGSTPIVCLPHKLIIELDRTEAPELDAIVR